MGIKLPEKIERHAEGCHFWAYKNYSCFQERAEDNCSCGKNKYNAAIDECEKLNQEASPEMLSVEEIVKIIRGLELKTWIAFLPIKKNEKLVKTVEADVLKIAEAIHEHWRHLK